MWWGLIITPLLWALVVLYTRAQQRSIARGVAAGDGSRLFHEHYADYFSSLQPGERITHAWQGLAYEGPESRENPALAVARYVLLPRRGYFAPRTLPTVAIVLTSHGRVVVAKDFGSSRRSRVESYSEVTSFDPGVHAVDVAPEHPAHGSGRPPNPFDPSRPLQLTAVTGTDGRTELYWLMPQVPGGFASLSGTLPKPPGDTPLGPMS